jgi:hypothetical protein
VKNPVALNSVKICWGRFQVLTFILISPRSRKVSEIHCFLGWLETVSFVVNYLGSNLGLWT